MAESDTTVIDALTDWIVNAAVDAYQVLAELGVSVPIAVNMSTLNLHDLTVPDRLEQRLRAGDMPAKHLCLEITESAAFKDAAMTMDILSRMRLKGMQLSIDDFGTGYSSLKMLRQMPFSEIKIDQSFVGDATTSRDSRAIVKSIMDLAANMEMGCVAEGVETEETAELLERLGSCDMQGYLIAAPMPVEAIPAWLAGMAASHRCADAGRDEAGLDCSAALRGGQRRAAYAAADRADAVGIGRVLCARDGAAARYRHRHDEGAVVAGLCRAGRAQPRRSGDTGARIDRAAGREGLVSANGLDQGPSATNANVSAAAGPRPTA